MKRTLFGSLLLGITLTLAGCGSGAFDRLGDIPDHCKIGPAAQGWIDLRLQCVTAIERPESVTIRKRPDNNGTNVDMRYAV